MENRRCYREFIQCVYQIFQICLPPRSCHPKVSTSGIYGTSLMLDNRSFQWIAVSHCHIMSTRGGWSALWCPSLVRSALQSMQSPSLSATKLSFRCKGKLELAHQTTNKSEYEINVSPEFLRVPRITVWLCGEEILCVHSDIMQERGHFDIGGYQGSGLYLSWDYWESCAPFSWKENTILQCCPYFSMWEQTHVVYFLSVLHKILRTQ